MDGIDASWLPSSFRGWRHRGPIIDDHVHVNASGSITRTFAKVASSFGITAVGAITRGFLFPDPVLPGSGITTFAIPAVGEARFEDLEAIAAEGARAIKFWFGTSYFHGRKRIDTPVMAARMRDVGKAGMVAVMHVSDPDTWHATQYPARIYGTKQEIRAQATWLVEQCPETTFVLVHMGGNPEDPAGLATFLDDHPNAYLDTSATKWVSRELSRHHDAAVELFRSHPGRILFGSDITMPPWGQGGMTLEGFFASRYLVQRLLLEHDGGFVSPIEDPDNPDGRPLRGLGLDDATLDQVYHANAARVFKPGGG